MVQRLSAPPITQGKYPTERVGIFAYGSILTDLGCLETATEGIIAATSPFPVEYARYSSSRGYAPTLVPVVAPQGSVVRGGILLLKETIRLQHAQSLLWQRETRAEKLKPFKPGKTPNSVQIELLSNLFGVRFVLYTDFLREGKIPNPDPQVLAHHAISSVRLAPAGKDGITYLMANLGVGICTPLTNAYQEEILRETCTKTLAEALEVAKSG